jgi:hypothetical protein
MRYDDINFQENKFIEVNHLKYGGIWKNSARNDILCVFMVQMDRYPLNGYSNLNCNT